MTAIMTPAEQTAELTADIADRIRAADRGKVRIDFVYPPIPLRSFDWCASFDDDEPDDDGHMLCGYGRTKSEALLNLLDNLDERTA